MNRTILIVGGYGVFGSRLARGLLKRPDFDVVIAGRSNVKAARFCKENGGRALVLDREMPDLAAKVAQASPAIVIDAAGPFQAYGAARYALAEAAIDCGAHYLDLSDDAGFTLGIATLDRAARARDVCVLSGVSSVPALSSAAVEALIAGLDDIHLIESVILPGNRAPRGLSVIRSILSQAGRPVAVHRGGRTITVPGWSQRRKERLVVAGAEPLGTRWSSLIGAPDLRLFPARYNARSVVFRAGLELGVMHHGLAWLAGLVRLRLIRSVVSLAAPLKWLADRLEPMGSDRGGMVVRVLGTRSDGSAIRHDWTLLAEAGDGPYIPTIPARVMCERIFAGRFLAGARPCLGEFTLEEAESAAEDLRVVFGRSEDQASVLFRTALGQDFERLPAPVRDLHMVLDARQWSGSASVERGHGFLARLICRAVGFPEAGDEVPASVSMQRNGEAEVWERTFGGRRFRSVLTLCGAPGTGIVHERFGPFRFEIHLTLDEEGLHYPVGCGTFFGIPLPGFITPRSETVESTADGRASFDVSISLPFVGRLVRYRGVLDPTANQVLDKGLTEPKFPRRLQPAETSTSN